MPTLTELKQQKRAIVDRYHRADNRQGWIQIGTTLLPLAVLWSCVAPGAGLSYGLTAGVVALMALFLLRVFVLMHECGHGSLFRTARFNQVVGFVLGVVSGMPAYVWSQHHQYHHTTNGNWDKYRGPLSIISVDEYAGMSARQQYRYRHARALWLAPFGGFLYLIFNPRIFWLRGSISLVGHLIRRKIAHPGVSSRAHLRGFKTSYWSSWQEYEHMFWNNLVLIALWGMMAWLLGPLLFFVCYVASLSLAGGAGLILFTVQHNFERSYASRDKDWDYHAAAIQGTSYLQLPRWLNWFTANIGYHHVHHLSARIPNYRLAACHHEYRHLFADVTRIKLAQIPHALKYILWDTHGRRIVSVADCQPQAAR